MQPRLQLKPMGVVDQLDASFQLYRQHFATFIGTVAIIHVPIMVLSLIVSVFIFPLSQRMQELAPDIRRGDYTEFFTILGLFFVSLMSVGVLGGLAQTLMTGALGRVISQAYLGGTVSIADAYGHMFGQLRFLKLLVGSFIVGILLIVPVLLTYVTCALALPLLIYLALRMGLMAPAIVLEDRGPIDGLTRSWELAQGHLLRALGLWIIVILVSFIVSAGVTWVFSLLFIFLDLPQLVQTTVSSAAGSFAQMFVLPILLGASTLFYYDLRIRKEGFDLMMQAQLPSTPSESGGLSVPNA